MTTEEIVAIRDEAAAFGRTELQQNCEDALGMPLPRWETRRRTDPREARERVTRWLDARRMEVAINLSAAGRRSA